MADLISLLPNNTAQRPAPAVNDVMADPMLMCLAMAAKLLDRPVHMQVLRAGFALDVRGRVPLAAYPDLAHKHGLMAAWSRIKINEVPAYVLPVLMPLMDGRACVVRAIEGNEAVVMWAHTGMDIQRVALSELQALARPEVLLPRCPKPPGRFR